MKATLKDGHDPSTDMKRAVLAAPSKGMQYLPGPGQKALITGLPGPQHDASADACRIHAGDMDARTGMKNASLVPGPHVPAAATTHSIQTGHCLASLYVELDMKKLKPALYIGMPLFGISLLSSSRLPIPFPQILGSIDAVPLAIMFFIHEGLLLRNFDGYVHDTLEALTFFMAHIVFWVPVAHGINKLWERRERSRKNPIQ